MYGRWKYIFPRIFIEQEVKKIFHRDKLVSVGIHIAHDHSSYREIEERLFASFALARYTVFSTIRETTYRDSIIGIVREELECREWECTEHTESFGVIRIYSMNQSSLVMKEEMVHSTPMTLIVRERMWEYVSSSLKDVSETIVFFGKSTLRSRLCSLHDMSRESEKSRIYRRRERKLFHKKIYSMIVLYIFLDFSKSFWGYFPFNTTDSISKRKTPTLPQDNESSNAFSVVSLWVLRYLQAFRQKWWRNPFLSGGIVVGDRSYSRWFPAPTSGMDEQRMSLYSFGTPWSDGQQTLVHCRRWLSYEDFLGERGENLEPLVRWSRHSCLGACTRSSIGSSSRRGSGWRMIPPFL